MINFGSNINDAFEYNNEQFKTDSSLTIKIWQHYSYIFNSLIRKWNDGKTTSVVFEEINGFTISKII